jgi:hypothetical protein
VWAMKSHFNCQTRHLAIKCDYDVEGIRDDIGPSLWRKGAEVSMRILERPKRRKKVMA